MTDFVDERYKTLEGLRWTPETELARFLGKTYGSPWPYFTKAKGLSAGDLGCGNGRNFPLLFKYGFAFCGIDQSMLALQLAEQVLEAECPGLGLMVDLRQHVLPAPLPWPTERLDLVIDCQTTQHLNWLQRADAYKEVARVLRPGGRFWSMTWCGSAKAANKIYGGQYPELDYVTAMEFMEVLAECGLQPCGKPYRLAREYPEHLVEAEWLIAEAVKP